jgi:hypothetical protein
MIVIITIVDTTMTMAAKRGFTRGNVPEATAARIAERGHPRTGVLGCDRHPLGSRRTVGVLSKPRPFPERQDLTDPSYAL